MVTTGSGKSSDQDTERTTVVLLGTQAGPPAEKDRAGISSALVVGGSTYLIDCGRSALTQFVKADLRLSSVRGVFITHLHHDHVADYYNFFLLGGIGPNGSGDILTGTVPVYGPGTAGILPVTLGDSVAATINPRSPTPGLAELTARCHDAYAYSSNLFIRDSGIKDVRTLLDVREIRLPVNSHPITATAPITAPFEILEDENVRVTATLVPHGRCFPSFAYRFDTKDGSVTFSGDTTVSDNLITLAFKSDILVHEAVNVDGAPLTKMQHDQMLRLHTEVQNVGPVADRAGVTHLVLSHLIDFARPIIDPGQWMRWASQGYNGQVTVGADLQRISMPR